MLWVNFFDCAESIYTSILIKYLNEISLLVYIPIFIIFRNMGYTNLYSKYIFFLCLNLLYLFLIFISFQLLAVNLGSTLLFTKYVLFSKFIVLFIGLLILLVIKDKLFKAYFICSDFLLLFNTLLFYLLIFISSFDFIILLVSMEGISFILYGLGGFLIINLISLESIIKYFILSSITGCLSILGISLIYAIVGSLDFLEIQAQLNSNLQNLVCINISLILFLTLFGFFFKLAFFPFHWWISEVYEGLWTPITICFAVLIKISFFLLFFRLLSFISYPVLLMWQPFFLASGIGSVLVGTFSALYQTRIKSFLACSSISQIGLILLGLSSYSLNGLTGAFIHLFIYSFINLIFFFLVLNTNNLVFKRNALYLHELSLFRRYNPQESYFLSFSILIMAAFPPFGSFLSKVIIYVSLLEAKLDLIVFLLLFFNVISTIYYIRFVQDIFFFTESSFNFLKSNYLFFLDNFRKVLKIFFQIIVLGILFLVFFLKRYYSFILFILLSCYFPFVYF